MADAAPAEHDPIVGRTLAGRYAATARLGSGSMGAVYRATDLAAGREVAVKILHTDRTVDEAANARFQREARANRLLVSPHTVQVLDFGQAEGGELFLVMELLEGEPLRRRLARLGRLPAEVAIDICRQALRSLAEAHGKGIVHRDLKPDNLFFATGPDGVEALKVLDFGVAKMLGEEGKQFNAVETREGHVLGTPRYMSPEQAEGKPLDARSDLYSLGVILYEMLASRPPFTSDNPVVVMAQHITKHAPPFSVACPGARVPTALEELVMRALAKAPAERPASAEALDAELSALLVGGRLVAPAAAPADAGAHAGGHPDPDGVTHEVEPESETVEVRRMRGRPRAGVVLGIAAGLGMMVGVVWMLQRAQSAPPAEAPLAAVAATGSPEASPPATSSALAAPALPSTSAPSAAPATGAAPSAPAPGTAPATVLTPDALPAVTPTVAVGPARGPRVAPRGPAPASSKGGKKSPPPKYDYLE